MATDFRDCVCVCVCVCGGGFTAGWRQAIVEAALATERWNRETRPMAAAEVRSKSVCLCVHLKKIPFVSFN